MRFLAPCAAALLLRVGVALWPHCAVLRCVPLPSCTSRPGLGQGSRSAFGAGSFAHAQVPQLVLG